jgi:hypothetical protein
MSDTRQPTRPEEGFNDGFEQELMEMWQENTCPTPGSPGEYTPDFPAWVAKFDRKVFWQNFAEYAAVAIVLVRSVHEIDSGDRPLIAPLASITAAIFIGCYLWRKHRGTPSLDPMASAKTYRDALVDRLNRQIELARSVRYWYVLPVWCFFLVVFAGGTIRMLANPVESGSTFLFLAIEFLLATAICVLLIWLNERYRVPKLQKEIERVKSIQIQGPEETVL